MAETVKPQDPEVHVVPSGQNPDLKTLQGLVGGLIQPIYYQPGKVMWVNEEGLLLGLPLNMLASAIAGQPVVGPVVIMDDEEQ